MNIYLTGYRCTGKTLTGNALATYLNKRFIDTDSEIVKIYNLSIKQIVENNGWDEFREKEKSVIKQISGFDNYVVATGGGIVLDPENIVNIKKSGIVIWLKGLPETIFKRIKQDPNTDDFRPSLTSKGLFEEIKETLSQRNLLYEKAANFSVDTDAMTIPQVAYACLEIIHV